MQLSLHKYFLLVFTWGVKVEARIDLFVSMVVSAQHYIRFSAKIFLM